MDTDMRNWLCDLPKVATITEDLATTLADQNVRYAEVTTTAYTHFMDKADRSGMSATDYRDGLNEGRRRAARLGVGIGWVVDIPRDLEMPDSSVTIDYLEGPDTPDGLVGIGLGGYEVGFPASPTPTISRGPKRSACIRCLTLAKPRAPTACAQPCKIWQLSALATVCAVWKTPRLSTSWWTRA